MSRAGVARDRPGADFGRTGGQRPVADLGPASVIVRDIRLPRTVLAILIGWVFGLTGAALQALLRNPLADTAVFGAPQAAAFGAVLVLYFGLAGALSWALPVAAIGGALVSMAIVVLVAGRNPTIVVLVLAGLAVGSLAGAATSLAISLSPNPYAVTEIVFWLLGSLEDRSRVHVLLAAPFVLLATRLLLPTRQGLRALALGEEAALSLGVRVGALRVMIVFRGRRDRARAPSVAVAGSIGFIGLVSPHLVRPLVGYDPARTLVPAGLAGRGSSARGRRGRAADPLRPGGEDRRSHRPHRRSLLSWIIARRKGELAEMPA